MGLTPLAKKLRIGPGMRLLVLNPPPGYLAQLGELPEGAELLDKPSGNLDFVHLFVRNQSELQQFGPGALAAVKYDGVLWLSYPKRSAKVETDLTRDHGWELLAEAGLRPVTQVSVDDTWSALRYRPVERVSKR